MSTTVTTKTSLRIPWLFLGGYLVSFVGLGAILVGGFDFAKASQGVQLPLVFVGLGMAACTAGGLVMARADQIKSHHLPGLVVCFIMTPLPALLGLGINYIGNWLRRKPNVTWQVLLLGVGVFLLTLAMDGFWGVQQAASGGQELRAVAWVFLAELGVIAMMLAALPLFSAISNEDREGALETD